MRINIMYNGERKVGMQKEVQKIVSSFKNFLNNSRQDVKTIKYNGEIEFTSEELEEFVNEIVMELSSNIGGGKMGIYERNVNNDYLVEFFIKIGKSLFVFHLFFEKIAGKYKLYSTEMSKFFNEKL